MLKISLKLLKYINVKAKHVNSVKHKTVKKTCKERYNLTNIK